MFLQPTKICYLKVVNKIGSMVMKQFRRGINYEDIDLEELGEADLRSVEQYFEDIEKQMSGVVGSEQSNIRQAMYEELWEDTSVDELVEDSLIEADRLSAPGHTVRNVTGHLQSYKDNRNFDLSFDYDVSDGALEIESVHTEEFEKYQLESGLTRKKEVLERLSDEVGSEILYQEDMII